VHSLQAVVAHAKPLPHPHAFTWQPDVVAKQKPGRPAPMSHASFSVASQSHPNVGACVGWCVGTLVGAVVGPCVGLAVGALVGSGVGALDGCAVGCLVGLLVGRLVGCGVGFLVGCGVGAFEGGRVGQAAVARSSRTPPRLLYEVWMYPGAGMSFPNEVRNSVAIL
jgi:hypothetical protein